MDIAGLQLLDGVGNCILLRSAGVAAETSGASDHVAKSIRLDHNRKQEIRRSLDLLGKRLDIVGLVSVETVLGEAQLARRVASAAITVRQVVEDQADDLLLAGRRLHSAGFSNGLVDVVQEEDVGDPDERADVLLHVLHLRRVGLVTA